MLKSLILTMLPTARIHFDTDDADDLDGVVEEVQLASVFLCFLTTNYVGSPRCLAELTTAFVLHKPIVIVREGERRYGGLSIRGAHEEIDLLIQREGRHMSDEELGALRYLKECPVVNSLEWHSEKYFKHAVLRRLAEVMYHYTTSSLAVSMTRRKHARGSSTPATALALSTPRRPTAGTSSPGSGPSSSMPLTTESSQADRPSSLSEHSDMPVELAVPVHRRGSLLAAHVIPPVDSPRITSPQRSFMPAGKAGAMSSAPPSPPPSPTTDTSKSSSVDSPASKKGSLFRRAVARPEKAEPEPELRPQRLMRMRDEFVLAPEKIEGTVLYLSEHYKALPHSGVPDERRPDWSMYDEVASQFEALGVKVASNAGAAFSQDQRSLLLLVICPGFFSYPPLVEETAHALRALNSTRRGTGFSIGPESQHLDSEAATSSHDSEGLPRQGNGAVLRVGLAAQRLRGLLRGPAIREEDAARPGLGPKRRFNPFLEKKPKHVVSLYTTASPLDEYMRACPADLKEFGPHQHVECVTSVPLWR